MTDNGGGLVVNKSTITKRVNEGKLEGRNEKLKVRRVWVQAIKYGAEKRCIKLRDLQER